MATASATPLPLSGGDPLLPAVAGLAGSANSSGASSNSGSSKSASQAARARAANACADGDELEARVLQLYRGDNVPSGLSLSQARDDDIAMNGGGSAAGSHPSDSSEGRTSQLCNLLDANPLKLVLDCVERRYDECKGVQNATLQPFIFLLLVLRGRGEK